MKKSALKKIFFIFEEKIALFVQFSPLFETLVEGKKSFHPNLEKKGLFFMKNSFVLYYDVIGNLDYLTDRELGKLMRAVFKYELEGAEPSFKDRLMLSSFVTIKNSLDRSKEKYEKVCQKNRKAASSRWEKEKEMHSNSDVCKCIPTDAKNADSDSDSDSVSDSDSDSDSVYVSDSVPVTEKVHPQKRDAQMVNTYTPSAEKTESKGDFFTQKEQLYGLFRNVRLLPAEYQQLKNSFPDADKRIEELSAYISSSGKSYENHFAKLTQWVSFAPTKKEKPRDAVSPGSDAAYDIDEYMQRAYNLSDSGHLES